MRQIIIPLVATTILTFITVGTSQAIESCTDLKAQLVTAEAKTAGSKKIKRYSDAIKKQTKMIAKIDADLSRYNCEGGSNAACKQLNSSKKKMSSNLGKLTKKQDILSKGSGKLSISQIKAQLEAFNCSKSKIIKVATNPTAEDLGNGVKLIGKSGGRKPPSRVIALPNSSRSVGSYRTMCVRSCDGYFFPISSNTSSSSFKRDEIACQLMCPGTETNLYFHRSQGQESEDMISYRGGQSYDQLPKAFAYRKLNAKFSEACSCNMSAFHAEMARREELLKNKSVGQDTSNTITNIVPSERFDPGEDPETVSNLRGKLTDEDIQAITSASNDGKSVDDLKRKVRIVGPVFLQDNVAFERAEPIQQQN
tara:strand:+ start:834 stop:1931 length:1098 start_codon:yes stop_codon:yes gene_type:complete